MQGPMIDDDFYIEMAIDALSALKPKAEKLKRIDTDISQAEGRLASLNRDLAQTTDVKEKRREELAALERNIAKAREELGRLGTELTDTRRRCAKEREEWERTRAEIDAERNKLRQRFEVAADAQ